jgi:hypothetical protein
MGVGDMFLRRGRNEVVTLLLMLGRAKHLSAFLYETQLQVARIIDASLSSA